MEIRITQIVLIIITFISNSFSQDLKINLPINERLDLVLNNYMIKYNVKGLSASINIGSKNVWKGTVGISHETIKIDTSSLFGIGSITKTITATIILQLYEEGRLDIYDSISTWLSPHEHIDPSITIEQLLTHTSGIYDFSTNTDLRDSLFAYPYKKWLPDESMKYLKEPYFKPGTGFYYSNSNYILLGMIIEKVTGNSYSNELKNRILTPLNLRRTCVDPDDELFNELVHVWEGNNDITSTIKTRSVFSIAWSGGAIISTAYELSKFFSHLLYHKSLLTDTTIHKMINLEKNGYGYAIRGEEYQRYNRLTKVYGHGGDIGYIAGAVYIPEDSVSIGVICNQNDDLSRLVPLLYSALINHAPNEINFSNDIIPAGTKINTVVGIFSTNDTNNHTQNSFRYSMARGDGFYDADNDCFAVSGRYLILNCDISNMNQNVFRILVESKDDFGGSIINAFELRNESTNVVRIESVLINSIYPNPANSEINIQFSSYTNGVKAIKILDVFGRIIETYSTLNNLQPISLYDYKAGVYYIKIHYGNKSDTKIFIKN